MGGLEQLLNAVRNVATRKELLHGIKKEMHLADDKFSKIASKETVGIPDFICGHHTKSMGFSSSSSKQENVNTHRFYNIVNFAGDRKREWQHTFWCSWIMFDGSVNHDDYNSVKNRNR